MKNLTERAKEYGESTMIHKPDLHIKGYISGALAERKRIVGLIEATRTDAYVYDIDSLLTKINEDE